MVLNTKTSEKNIEGKDMGSHYLFSGLLKLRHFSISICELSYKKKKEEEENKDKTVPVFYLDSRFLSGTAKHSSCAYSAVVR